MVSLRFTHSLAAPAELASMERMIGRQLNVTHRIIAPTGQSSVGSCMFGFLLGYCGIICSTERSLAGAFNGRKQR